MTDPASRRVLLCYGLEQFSFTLMVPANIQFIHQHSNTSKSTTMNPTFKASETLTRKIAFGGFSDGINFAGEVAEDCNTFDDFVGYYGGAKGLDDVLLGYVVYNDSDSAPANFCWELGEAQIAAGYVNAEVSIGIVTLTRELFDDVMSARA